MNTSVNSTKCSVRFAPKDSYVKLQQEPKRPSLIMLHFHCPGLRMKYSTGFTASLEDWNVEKQRIKTNKAGIVTANEANELMNKMETALRKEYARMLAEGIAVQKEHLKDILDNFTDRRVEKEDAIPWTFWQFTDYFLAIKEKQVTASTLKQYKQLLKGLRKYEAYYRTKIIFEDIDIHFYHKYVDLMENEDYALNTIGKHIKNLKVLMNYALLEGFTTNNKFKRADFKVLSETTTAVYLDEDEIESLSKVDLTYDKNLERARDLFLVGCYTGQRISDFNRLKKDQIVRLEGTDFFRVKQKKTGKIVHCPITKEMRAIFKTYEDHPPKTMPDQKLNEYIKTVARRVGLKDLVSLHQTKGGRTQEEREPKYRLISSHTARRSFCTNMYKKRMPVYDIMLFSGHTTEKEFYNYIRIKDEERASHVARSGYFNL